MSSNNSLEPFWEAKRAQDGRIFFVNHQTQTTTWEDPRPLGAGWRMSFNENGRPFFINDKLCFKIYLYL